MKKILLIFILLFAVPNYLLANEKLSQQFINFEAYFPLNNKAGLIMTYGDLLTETGIFYYAEDISKKQTWKQLDFQYNREDNQRNNNSGNLAIPFKDYAYINFHTINNDILNQGSECPNKSCTLEVWRVSMDNPTKIENVFSEQISYNDQSDMIVFKDKLFIMSATGRLWSTKDGVNWKEINTNLKNKKYFVSLSIINNKLYTITTDNLEGMWPSTTIHKSKNGKKWFKASNLEISGEDHIYQLHNYKNHLFVTAYNLTTKKIQLWQRKNKQWQMLNSDTVIIDTDNSNSLLILQYDNFFDKYVIKKKRSKKFIKIGHLHRYYNCIFELKNKYYIISQKGYLMRIN